MEPHLCILSPDAKISLWLPETVPSAFLGGLRSSGGSQLFPHPPQFQTQGLSCKAGREVASTLARAFTPSFTRPIHVKDLQSTGCPCPPLLLAAPARSKHRKMYSLECDPFHMSAFHQLCPRACMGTHTRPPLLLRWQMNDSRSAPSTHGPAPTFTSASPCTVLTVLSHYFSHLPIDWSHRHANRLM